CGLHRVGDSERRVLALRQPADEKDSARESDDLDHALDESVIADAAGLIERSSEDRRRRFVQNRRGGRDEEAHEQITCATVPLKCQAAICNCSACAELKMSI